MGDTRWAAGLVGTSVGLLAWSNVLVPRLPVPSAVRTAANVVAALGLGGYARAAGLSWRDLGLSRADAGPGLRHAAAAVAAVGAGYGLLLLLPPGREALVRASRARGGSSSSLARELLIHIPAGTVLAEEVAFRGVLDALARRVLDRPAAAVWQSAVFALWHLRPAWTGNRGAGRGPGGLAETLAVTAAGGLLMTWLRRRSGSLLAPVGLHLATNGLGLAAATLADRSAQGLRSADAHPRGYPQEGRPGRDDPAGGRRDRAARPAR